MTHADAELVEGRGQLGGRRHVALALAVVAEAGGLDDRRERHPIAPSPATANGAVGTPMPARNRFSAMRSWAIATAAAGGATDTSRGQPVEGLRRRVLELRRHDGARPRPGGRGRRHRRTPRRGARRRRDLRAHRDRDRARPCRSPSAAPRAPRTGRADHRRACRRSPAGRSRSLLHHRFRRRVPCRRGAPVSRRPCSIVRSLEDSLPHVATGGSVDADASARRSAR